MTTNYELLLDKKGKRYLVNSHLSKQPEGGYQIHTGLAYLEAPLPSQLEVYTLDKELVGTVIFSPNFVSSLKTVASEANTTFDFQLK